MSTFLIAESTKFYLSTEDGKLDAFLKAIISEGIVIVFSILKAESTLQKWTYRTIAAATGIFCVLILSMGHLKTTLDQHHHSRQVSSASISELKTQLDHISFTQGESTSL